MSAKKQKDAPLSAKIEGEQLVIRIGINVLADGVINSPDTGIVYDEEKQEYIQRWKIHDPAEFAKDVVNELEREEEDGSSPLTKLFDAAGVAAIEDGSTAVDECNEVYKP